jgi:hypothetical protein
MAAPHIPDLKVQSPIRQLYFPSTLAVNRTFLVSETDNGRLVAQSSCSVDDRRCLCHHLSPYRQYFIGS